VNLEKGIAQNMRGNAISLKGERGDASCDMPVRQYELELDDDNFKTFAFKTHPLAYLDAGLADLSISDLSKIGMQPNIQEWGDLRTLKQAGVSGWPVAKKKAHAIWKAATDPVGDALNHLMER